MIIYRIMAWLKILKNGFRKGGSCLNNRLQFLDQVTRSIDVHIVYLDFVKDLTKFLTVDYWRNLKNMDLVVRFDPGLQHGSMIDVNRCV